jgi:hypothetical protein
VTVRAVLALTLLVIVPGLGASVAAFGPGRLRIATRLASMFAFGYALVGAVSFILAILRILNPTTFFAVLGVTTAVLWFLGLRTASPADHGRALAAEVRGDPFPIVVGLLVVACMAIVALSFSPLLNLGPSASWRYWVDGREIADAGRIPAASLQYGMLLPPTVSKVFLNAFEAGASYAVGVNPLPALGALAWLAAVGLAAALWSMGREMGLRLTAPLLPLLLVMNRDFLTAEPTLDLFRFKAEAIGRMTAFCAVALIVPAIRDRVWRRESVAGGVLLGITAGTHLVPTAVAAAILASYVAARLLLDRRRAVLTMAALAACIGVIVGLAILFLPSGDIGFQGAVGNRQYASFGPNFDPTRYLLAGVVSQRPHRPTGRFYLAPTAIVENYVVRATRISRSSRLGRHLFVPLEYLLVVGGPATAVAMLLWFPSSLKPLGLVAWGLGAFLIAGTLYFSARYDLYVLARFGERRLFDYAAFPVGLMGLAIVEAGAYRLGRRFRPRAAVAAVSSLVLLVAVLLVPGALPGARTIPTTSRLEALEWLRQNTPCDARILASQRTTGIFEAVTGRAAVTEGMAPYLRPQILAPVVQVLLGARAFVEHPGENADFLTTHGIDYVVVLKAPLGAPKPLGKPDIAALRALASMTLVHEDGSGLVFRVNDPGPGRATFPDAVGFPGYRCGGGPAG